MADQTDLLAQLLLGSTGKAAIAAEDPYLGFQKEVSDPLSQLILGATGPGIKTKDKIIGGLLTGLISGIAGGASEDYQTRANKAYQDVIQKSILAGPDSLLQGSPEITRPDVLSPSVFDAAKQNAQMFSVVNRLKQEDLAAQNANALNKTIVSKQASLINQAVTNGELSLEEGTKRLQGLMGGVGKVPSMPGTETTTPIDATTNSTDAPIGNSLTKLMDAFAITDPTVRESIKSKKDLELYLKNKPKSGLEVPYSILTEMTKSKGVIDEAGFIAKELEGGTTWLELQAAKKFSGADQEGIALIIKNAADRLGRARTGAAMNPREEKLYESLLGGDISAGPKQIAMLLRKLVAAENRINNSQIDLLEAAQTKGYEGLREMFKDPVANSTVRSYTQKELSDAGYTANDIASLRAQGLVK